MRATSSSDPFDVAVLGGGVIGLGVAWRAAASGRTVVLLERGSLGGAAAHVAAGMLAPVAEADPGERALLELGLQAAAAWPAFAAELAAASGRDPGLRETGTLVVARDRDEAEALERERELRASLGLEVRPLLPSAARREEPALAPSLRAAFLAPGDHSVDPRLLCAALAQGARRAGADLRERAAVAEAHVADGVVVLEGGEEVRARRVVVATGAWAGALPGLPALPVRPVKGQTLRLRDRTGTLLGRTVRYEGGYLVPRAVAPSGGAELVLGATVEERGFDVAMTAGGIYELLRDAAELVPGVLECDVVEVLAGLRPGTPDNTPVVGTRDGVVLACGHYRNGILLAPVTADLVLGELDGIAAPAALSPDRFAATPSTADLEAAA